MMNAVFKKLNLKDQSPLFVINAPPAFKPLMEEMKPFAQVKTSLTKAKEITFFLAFVTKQNEVNDIAKQVIPMLADDGLFWLAYPKGTSKNYKCEFNRDNGWAELGKAGYEGVRMVAIDEDWSALRFRKAEKIKTMTRGFAMSEAGKQKVAAQKKQQ